MGGKREGGRDGEREKREGGGIGWQGRRGGERERKRMEGKEGRREGIKKGGWRKG